MGMRWRSMVRSRLHGHRAMMMQKEDALDGVCTMNEW